MASIIVIGDTPDIAELVDEQTVPLNYPIN